MTKAAVPTEMLQLSESEQARFDAKVGEPDENGCLPWVGPLNTYGYGNFYIPREGRNRHVGAHRVAYVRGHGPFRSELVVDHICGRPACVNVDHLRVVTVGQNCQHRAGLHRTNRSGVRGVCWNRQYEAWEARVYLHNRHAWSKRFNPRTLGVSKGEALRLAEEAVLEARLRIYSHSDPEVRS